MASDFADALRTDARLFPQQIDLIADQLLLAELSEADYRTASFLDQRVLTPERKAHWTMWSNFEAAAQSLPFPGHYIFHIGHVGSTLLSRLLAELPGILPLREPQILRQFAEMQALEGKPESLWPPGLVETRLATVLRAHSRGFPAAPTAMIKASSFVSEIAAPILAHGGRAALLYVKPERYIETILAGENSRKELVMLGGARLTRLNRRVGGEVGNLWEMPEATRAAMAWACEMTALEEASDVAGEQARWIDFDRLLENLPGQLVEIAGFYGLSLDISAARTLAEGPIMRSYSKAPEHDYSPQLREQLLTQARQARSGDIASALAWLEQAGEEFALIGKALNRATTS